MPPPPRSLIERVSLSVLQHLPSSCCFACIAAELNSTESEVRDAAEMLIIQQAFRPAVRQCFKCSRTEETLVREKRLRIRSPLSPGTIPG
jgi:hypothetical protein